MARVVLEPLAPSIAQEAGPELPARPAALDRSGPTGNRAGSRSAQGRVIVPDNVEWPASPAAVKALDPVPLAPLKSPDPRLIV